MATRGLTPPPGIPIPEAPQITPQPAPIPQNLTGPDIHPRQPGATSTAGGVAYVADKFLKGWMAGRYMGQERQMQQARQQISDARTTVDVAGQAYQALKSAGKPDSDPEVQKAKTALTSAWSSYLQMAEKYVTPQPQPGQKKPGFGSRMKQALGGGGTPHIFLQSSLDVLKKVDPTVFYGETEQQATQRQLDQAKLAEVKKEQNYEQILAKPDEQRTPQEKQFVEGYERAKFGPKPQKEVLEDRFYKEVASGQSKNWTPDQRSMAQQLGIIHRDQYSMIPETVTDPHNYRAQKQVIHVLDENGHEVRTIQSPFVNLLPPDHFQTAQQALDGQFAVWKKHFMAAGYDAKTAEKMSVEAISKGKWTGAPSADDQRLQNDALHFALSNLQKQYKAEHPAAGPEEVSAYMNKFQALVTQGPNGQLIYDGAALRNPKITYDEPGMISKLFGYFTGNPPSAKANPPSYAGGGSQVELGPMEQTLRSQMRAFLDKQKGLSREQADQIMGTSLVSPFSAMNAPPGAGMTPPTAGAKLYSLTINGETYQRYMTAEQAAAVGRNPSIKVSPIGGETGVESGMTQGPQ